jgi:ABC-type transporter Mla MlaB component
VRETTPLRPASELRRAGADELRAPDRSPREMSANERPSSPGARASSAIQPVARRWRPGPGGTVLVMIGPVTRDAIPALCERARRLLEGCDAGSVACDVGALAEPDGVTIDALARLQLTARRLGHRVELRRACEELGDLLTLTGLLEILTGGGAPVASAVEAWREPELREQVLRIEEEADPPDPTVGDLQDLQ